MYKESLEAIRGQLSWPRSDVSYIALAGDDERYDSAELPINENGATLSSLRARGYGAGRYSKYVIRRALLFLLPSFLARKLGHVDEDAAIPAATSTSYLNGLRGLAALLVAISHYMSDHMWVNRSWGQTPADYHLAQLPFVRLVYSGVFMVCVFFVLSGFALTYSPLKKCHVGQSADAIASLPSSVFRRPFRLFMPVIPTLVATTVAIQHQGFYQHNGISLVGPVAGGVWSQVLFVWGSLVAIITTSSINTIIPPAWTLSTEFQGSLLVFTCCLVFARIPALVRILCVLALLAFFLHQANWQFCLFLAGMIIGDIRQMRQKLPPLKGLKRKAASAASWMLLVVCLFVGGWPLDGNGYTAVGYSWLVWVPVFGMEPKHFFPSVAAVGLVVALENLPVLQRGLSSHSMLYLGEISFGMYLVHWLVSRSFTCSLKHRMLQAGYSMSCAWTVTFVMMLVFSIWLGDVNWRLVDKKSVRFSHWLSKKLGI
ncbi:acyltransferase [Colletotrichum graminicola M1.001]|uniref:Acyltransferase n=1 Tax=Colletotrichum graminicola (strain M1.001 / M2 / FGSC 10212) TaxID=645133 RepID=E3QLJ2_COLGM|nr:acyltransferase [Colletotrichum graminicola M1.001]EFQ31730.1 acyltransferase [Colletotrichum graminicola M1.001]